MLCKDCIESLRAKIVTGEPNKEGQVVKSISACKSSVFAFSENYIPLWFVYEQPIKSGKNKGKMKRFEEQLLFKSKFCPLCGKKFEDNENGGSIKIG